MARLLMLAVGLAALGWLPAQANDAPGGARQYCLACHLGLGPANPSGLAWQGPLAAERQSPCPAVRKIKPRRLALERRLRRNYIEMTRLASRRVHLGPLFFRLDHQQRRLGDLLAGPALSVAGMLEQIAAQERDLQRLLEAPLAQRKAQAWWRQAWGWLLMALFVVALALLLRRLHRLPRGRRRPRISTWLAGAVALALLLGAAAPARLNTMPAAPAHLGWREISLRRCLVLLELAAKRVRSGRPGARPLYLRALSLAQSLRQVREAAPGQGQAQAAALAELGQRVWPLVLVARESWQAAPTVAGRALDMALLGLVRRRGTAGRDWDLAGLVPVLALRDPARARQLAVKISDPAMRARTLGRLALLANAPELLELARASVSQVQDPRARARSLAGLGRLLWDLDRRQARTLFRRAYELAGQGPGERQAAFGRGWVAARLARLDAAGGNALARRTPPLAGARYPAFLAAARLWLSGETARARSTLSAAAGEAMQMEDPLEREKGISLAAQDMVKIDPHRARALLKALVPAARGQRDLVLAELALAAAARGESDLERRLAAIADGILRLKVTLRVTAAARRRPKLAQRLRNQARKLAARAKRPEVWAALARGLTASDPAAALKVALALPQGAVRARTLILVAMALADRGGSADARKALALAQKAVAALPRQRGALAARLLGDLAVVWSRRDGPIADRLFDRAAERASKME